VSGNTERRAEETATLLEREGEIAAIANAFERTRADRHGEVLLIDGPPGVGKTSLLGKLDGLAGDGRLLRARGSELEREFGFGVVRQLFGPLLRGLDADERAVLFVGPAGLAAAIFGLTEEGAINVQAAEASLYGLFWFVAALAERGPLVLAIDDAHWSDTASLRFVQYLGRRLDGIAVLVVVAARPNEPGEQSELVRELGSELEATAITPTLLSETATGAIVRAHFGRPVAPGLEHACHEATGGNPLLLKELLAELDVESPEEPSPESIATMGPKRIGAGLRRRARALDVEAPAILRAAAILGAAASLDVIAALAGIDPGRAVPLVDGLGAASILLGGPSHNFTHPLLRAAVYEEIPVATRAAAHSRAAALLGERGATPEEVAAHLLLAEPDGNPAVLEALEAAAARAAERGALESTIAYLQRALAEPLSSARRAELLSRLGGAEGGLRDPASIAHLQQAAELTDDPELALKVTLQLCELLSVAGEWDATVATVDSGLARFDGSGLPGLLDLEALRTAYRGYDPAFNDVYERDLPRLLELVGDRRDHESGRLRWVLAALGAIHDAPREWVIEMIGPIAQDWVLTPDGRESSLISHAVLALVIIDDLDGSDLIAAAVHREGRDIGALMSMIQATGYAAALDNRRGRLQATEANVGATVDLITANAMSLMALTTFVHFCLDAIVERPGLGMVADLVEGVEMPPAFARTFSGAMLSEVRAAVRTSRGDRAGALADLRAAEGISRPMRIGPRVSSWRSRLALALPDRDREEAQALVAEELELARAVDSPRAEGVALRALGVLAGGDAGVETLRESVATLRRCPSELEVARSLAVLGAGLRRANRRSEARDQLREAADLAQRCGGERLEHQIGEEMRVAGGKPRRREISGPASLTPAERRVATAAAGGATNREIAQTLFVSLRTVEMHLTSAYQKLDIATRTELARVLGTDAGAGATAQP
jgi:DNA-binding CsgD family transcriptional regulator